MDPAVAGLLRSAVDLRSDDVDEVADRKLGRGVTDVHNPITVAGQEAGELRHAFFRPGNAVKKKNCVVHQYPLNGAAIDQAIL
jgi:hypothetical protein